VNHKRYCIECTWARSLSALPLAGSSTIPAVKIRLLARRGQTDAALPCSLTAFSMPGAALAKSCAFITGKNVTLAL
jgi:hypothetical protein